MKLQSLCPFLAAWFTAVNHYTLFTISQPIFNQQEATNCSYKSQSELLLQARFPQMPSQTQLLHNPAEAGGFILRMNLNKWIKFQRLRQIPAIPCRWARDGLPSPGSTHVCRQLPVLPVASEGGSCCCLLHQTGHLFYFWSLSVRPGRAHERLCCWRCRRGEKYVLPRVPRVPTIFSALPKKPTPKADACLWGSICSDKTSLGSLAAHNISPYSPHCLSQYLSCNGEQHCHINVTFQDHSSSSSKIQGIMEDPTLLMRL